MGAFSGITLFGYDGDLLEGDMSMHHSKFDRTFALIAAIAVAIGVVAGFWVLGTPNRQRLIAADRERIEDLRSIAWRLHQDAEKARDRGQPVELPESLAERDRTTDPITNLAYEYHRLNQTAYELCAEFATDSSAYPLSQAHHDGREHNWRHPQGRHCFKFDLSEEPPPVFR